MVYKVVNASSIDFYEIIPRLEHKVNELCEEGWKPQGGIEIISYISTYAKETTYNASQAMVKED